MNYLIVAAHPDDEVLGAGAMMHNLIEKGHNVYTCIMNKSDETRYVYDSTQLVKDLHKSTAVIKVKDTVIGNFPNLRFNTVENIELVEFIERAIIEYEPDVIITHHPNDANMDHQMTSIACQQAARCGLRGRGYSKQLKELMFMEVKSATDWSFNCKFNPNTFYKVSKEEIELKIQALEVYENVIRPVPHPRSKEAILALASYRGSQSGCEYAECFETVFRREDNG